MNKYQIQHLHPNLFKHEVLKPGQRITLKGKKHHLMEINQEGNRPPIGTLWVGEILQSDDGFYDSEASIGFVNITSGQFFPIKNIDDVALYITSKEEIAKLYHEYYPQKKSIVVVLLEKLIYLLTKKSL